MIAEESGLAANSLIVSGLGLTVFVGFGVIKFESYLSTYSRSSILTLNRYKRQLKHLSTDTTNQLLIEVHHVQSALEDTFSMRPAATCDRFKLTLQIIT